MAADSAYAGGELKKLPPRVTWTTRLRKDAALYQLPPARTGKRGRPREKGDRLPCLVQLAATTAFTQVTVTRYGKTAAIQAAAVTCLWHSVFGTRPVTVVLIRDKSKTGYDLALVTTDADASAAAVIERYAGRWSVEVATEDSKQIFSAGQARNRTARAVERAIPFQLACQAIAVTWYATAGHDPADVEDHRAAPPGTSPRPSHRPPTWPLSSAGSSSPQNFRHLAPTSQPLKKSTSSAWPGKAPQHNRESRDLLVTAIFTMGHRAIRALCRNAGFQWLIRFSWEGQMAETLSAALDEAPLSRFHSRAIVTAGLGFFTDAYDLFIIGTASALIAKEWGLSTSATSFSNSVGLINSITLISAFVGAFVFGRIADVFGRKKIYGLEAGLMVFGALASAFAPNVIWLVIFRFILGIGVGGDYPVSAVLMSEFANRRSRGRLVGLVFSMQALGTVAGYVAGLALVSTGMNIDYVWRILLALGAVPAAAVLYLRRRMPESPRYRARVQGRGQEAAADITAYSEGVISVSQVSERQARLSLRQFLSNPRYLLYLLGTAGAWFVFDYAYYGNSVSAPLIYESVLGKTGSTVLPEVLALALIVFTVAAVPGYYLAAHYIDRIGHKRLQLIGFFCMGLAFLLIGVIPNVTTTVAPFLVLFGISYFFAEFGPIPGHQDRPRRGRGTPADRVVRPGRDAADAGPAGTGAAQPGRHVAGGSGLPGRGDRPGRLQRTGRGLSPG